MVRRHRATVDGLELVSNSAAAIFRVISAIHGKTARLSDEPDFAYMLAAQSGCYAWLGAGPATPGKLLHQPNYDFNDALLPLGVRYFVSAVETVLGKPSNR